LRQQQPPPSSLGAILIHRVMGDSDVIALAIVDVTIHKEAYSNRPTKKGLKKHFTVENLSLR